MRAIYQKELKTYFSSMTGYVFIGVLLLLSGIMCLWVNLLGGLSNFEYTLSMVSYIFLLIVPVLTMSVVADERRNKTDQLLYSLPLGTGRIILGKYFALVTVFACAVGVMCFYPLILSLYGTVNFLSAYAALLGFFLLGCALLAFGLFISSLTESPVIAAVISFFSLLFLYLLGSFASMIPAGASASFICYVILAALLCLIVYRLTRNGFFAGALYVIAAGVLCVLYFLRPALFEGSFPALMNWLCVYDRYTDFANGVFDLSAAVYYFSVTGIFVCFSMQSLEARRWNEGRSGL